MTEKCGSVVRAPFAEPPPAVGNDVDIATAARLVGEPTRALMLDALLAGRALTAGELAQVAGVSAATASEHLARMRTGGLVEVLVTGRHRYHRLASPEVAQALEALALIGPARPLRGPSPGTLRQAHATAAMLAARTCYDHLAGRAGVALHHALATAGALAVGGAGYDLTPSGEDLLATWGMDLAVAHSRRRSFARPCLDFTERRPHLAGALGAAMLDRMLGLGWLVPRTKEHRALRVTETGRRGFGETFGVDLTHDQAPSRTAG